MTAKALPLQWSVPDSKLVKWRVPVPGLGHSSPVVWGDHGLHRERDQRHARSAAEGRPLRRHRLGARHDRAQVDRAPASTRRTGKLLWERTATTGVPMIKRHPKSTHASSTLATDGRHVVAMFGSEGLYAYDLTGKLLWKKDFGVLDSGFFMVPDAQWGFASSPVIHDGRVIVQADVQKGSFVAAFDVRTGQGAVAHAARGRADLEHADGRVGTAATQVIVNGWKHIGGYDLATGKELWRMTGGGDIPVPTPIVGARPGLHHQRARQAGADLRDQADGDRRHLAARKARPRTRTSRGATCATAATCRRRSSTATSSTCAATTACSRAFDAKTGSASLPGAARRRQDRLHGVGGRGGRKHLLHERGRRRVRGEGRARRSSCWRRTRSAKWRWRRRRSRTACCSSARAITWWRSASVSRPPSIRGQTNSLTARASSRSSSAGSRAARTGAAPCRSARPFPARTRGIPLAQPVDRRISSASPTPYGVRRR